MYEDLTDLAIRYATKKGASYAEARLESSAANEFVLKNGLPEIAGFVKSKGIGIRLIVNGLLGFASTNELEKSKIIKLVDSAIKVAKRSSKLTQHPLKLAPEKIAKAKYKVKQKTKLANIALEKRLGVLFDIEKNLINTKIKLPARYYALVDGVTKKYFVNSEGTKINSEIPRVHLTYFFTIQEGAQTIQRIWFFKGVGGWELLKGWRPIPKIIGEAKKLHENLKFGKSAPKGVVDLVVAPEVVGIAVHESAGHPYEADRIFGREAAQAGESFINPDMIGQKIGSEIVTVVDDPTVSGSAGYYLYDDEGVKARRKFLIKKGRINEFLHNRETAVQMGLSSNGSARASDYGKEAIVRMSNTFMLPGDHTEQELIKGVKRGVYIKSFMEWNIDDKRYNQRYIGDEAYLIDRGKITVPIKKPILEITTPAFYSSIDALSKKIEFGPGTCGKGEPSQSVPVWMGGPSARLRNVRLGGA